MASAPLFPELEVSLLNSHVSSLNSLAVGFGVVLFWVWLCCRNWDAFSLGKKSCGAGFIVGYLLGSGCAPSLLHLERYCDDLGANPLF